MNAAASKPVSNAATSSAGSNAGSNNAAGAATQPDSFIFNLLSMSSDTDAASDLPSAESLASEEKEADSGNTSPSGGNVPPLSADDDQWPLSADNNLSPLVALFLPALPPSPGQPSDDVLLDTDLNLSASLSSPGLKGEESKGAPSGIALSDLDAGSKDSTSLFDGVLQEIARSKSSFDSAQPAGLQDQLKQVLASITSRGNKADGTVQASATNVSAGAAAPNAQAAVALASRLERDGEGVDGAVLQRVLSSLPQAGRSADATHTSAAHLQGGGANSGIASLPQALQLEMPAIQLSAAVAASEATKNAGLAANLETRQLLREITFDRVSGSNSSHSSTVVLSHGMSAPPAVAATNNIPVLQLPAPMHKPEWAEGLGERIVWLTDQNLSNAQIRLNPPHLGPIEVHVSVTDDQTNVSFMAHHAATRDALEAAAPRLREVLGSHGLGTINVNINQQSSSERSTQGQGYDAWHSFDPLAFEISPTTGATRPAARTLIDTYA